MLLERVCRVADPGLPARDADDICEESALDGFATGEARIVELLEAMKETSEQTVLLWPTIDAGADGVAQAVRHFREHDFSVALHADKTVGPGFCIPVLAKAAAVVVNSLSFARGASDLGTPARLIGSRQDGCEFCPAVNRVQPSPKAILTAIRQRVVVGRQSLRQPGVSARIVDAVGRWGSTHRSDCISSARPHCVNRLKAWNPRD
jgi:hypothetical protein